MTHAFTSFTWMIPIVTSLLLASSSTTLPDEQRIQADLIGNTVRYRLNTWTFGDASSIKSLTIQGQEKEGNMVVVSVDLLLHDADLDQDYQSKALVEYRLLGNVWEFVSVDLRSFDQYKAPDEINPPDEIKQRQTLDAIHNVGIAFMAYLADEKPDSVSSGSGSFSYEEVRSRLRPSDSFFYMDEPPQFDAWGNPLEFWVNSEEWPDFQLLVRSPGRDGVFESGGYRSENGEYQTQILALRSYDSDIVFVDGYWLSLGGSSARP